MLLSHPMPSAPNTAENLQTDQENNAEPHAGDLPTAEELPGLPQTAAPKEKPAQLILELLPLIAFFTAYKLTDIEIATVAIMIVTGASIAFQHFIYKRVPVMALITAGVVVVFGALTLILHNDTFIKMKPTMIYGIFAAILMIGRQMGFNPLQHVFGQMFHLSPKGWRILSWRWAVFFLAMAVANEILWRHISEDAWVNFKVFGALPMTLIFGMLQFPLLQRENLHK
jgi:intracellular septation protein